MSRNVHNPYPLLPDYHSNLESDFFYFNILRAKGIVKPFNLGIGNLTAIFIIIKASGIKMPYDCFIVKTAFCYKLAKIPGCWVQEGGLCQASP